MEKNEDANQQYKFATLGVNAGYDQRQSEYGDAVPPIHNTTTFLPGGPHKYTRFSNPSRAAFEKAIAALEMTNGGAGYGLSYPTGMSAISGVTLALLRPGDVIVAQTELFGGAYEHFMKDLQQDFGIEVRFARAEHIEDFAAKMCPRTKIVYVEGLSNPTLKVPNIREIAHVAHLSHALLVVDNTFPTPFFLRPLKLGADIVIHAVGKFLEGHSRGLMGASVVKDESLYQRLRDKQTRMGWVSSPDANINAWHALSTLTMRMQVSQYNALAIARYLKQHRNVEAVYYPGLEDDPGHELARQQMYGFSGIVSCLVRGGEEKALMVAEKLQLFSKGFSLGGVSSNASHCYSQSHGSLPPKVRKEMGVEPNLLRLSVGVEDREDLLADLDRALDW